MTRKRQVPGEGADHDGPRLDQLCINTMRFLAVDAVQQANSGHPGTRSRWRQFVGDQGVAIGIPHFGASAPAGVLYQEFGLTAQRMAEEASRLLTRSMV